MKESEHVLMFFARHPELNTPENMELVKKVNRLIDQFAHYPEYSTLSRHRKFLHHKEGVEWFFYAYGRVAAMAASEHIREDTDGMPDAIDYYTGAVDNFGLRRTKHAVQEREAAQIHVRQAPEDSEALGKEVRNEAER